MVERVFQRPPKLVSTLKADDIVAMLPCVILSEAKNLGRRPAMPLSSACYARRAAVRFSSP